jgi:hypothetical protein
MATTKIGLGNAIGSTIIEDTDADATAENDVNSGAATVHEIYIDNLNNTVSTYLKLWDNAAPTVGTTAPEFIVRGRKSRKTRVYLTPGLGHAMTNLSLAALTAAGTAGTTSPTNDVIARVRIS